MSRYKIIGADLKEYGPFTAEEMRRWLAEGRVDAQTKVQEEASGRWQRLAELPELAPHSPPLLRGRWTCRKCGEAIEEQFDSCWRCSTPRTPPPPAGPKSDPSAPRPAATKRRVEYKMYRGVLDSWDRLFAEAAAFATEIGRERLIGISHSEDQNDGVVAVWYWSDDSQP
jgi:hypothetical protein